MTMAFRAQRIPKKIVQRVRFRSTSEPPPKELPPPPMPNAPERPESLPECRSTRKIRITEMITSTTLSTVATGRECRSAPGLGPGPVDPLQDLDRLGTELGIEQPEVLIAELARGVIDLGIADLAVLGPLASLEVGQLRLGRVLGRRS